MQIHASLSRAFLQGSFDICILNTTSKDSKSPRGKAARHTLCLEMDYGWQHHIGIQTWVSHTIPVWDFCLRTLLGYITHSLDDGEIFRPLYIHYTSTFTYLPDNVSCPMPWHEWDATCEPGHFKCTECPQHSHYWGCWTSRKSGNKGLITHTCKHARQTTKRLRLLYHQTRS